MEELGDTKSPLVTSCNWGATLYDHDFMMFQRHVEALLGIHSMQMDRKLEEILGSRDEIGSPVCHLGWLVVFKYYQMWMDQNLSF